MIRVRLITDIETARQAILELGSEDYCHLADAAVYLPSIPPHERSLVAQEAMRELLRHGLVQLYFGRIASNDVSPLPPGVALRVIDDPRVWDVEQLYPNAYCFLNTDAGDGAYRMRFDRNSE